MQISHINIKGMEAYNGSYNDSFVAVYSLLAYEAEQLYRHFPTSNINDIKGYQCKILHKCATFFHTLFIVIEEGHDYYSAGTLIRMIADTLTSYNLIYHENNEDIKALRHYLFILDGLAQRKKYFDSHDLQYDGNISDEEYKVLQKQLQFSKANTLEAINVCKDTICKLGIYKTNKENIDILIQKSNWQFIDIERPKGHYKWEQLYTKINAKRAFTDMVIFMSQFVHGLSMSNLTMENDPKEFEPLIAFSISLMGETKDFIENDFGLTVKELLDGILNSRHFLEYFASMSESKQEECLALMRQSLNKE